MRQSPLPLGHRPGTSPSGREGRFRDERLQQRRIIRQDLSAKRLDMKPDGGLDIGKHLLIAVAFAHYHPFHAKRVSYIAVRVLLDDDLDLLHHASSEVYHVIGPPDRHPHRCPHGHFPIQYAPCPSGFFGYLFFAPQHASATANTRSSCSPSRHAPYCSLPAGVTFTCMSAISFFSASTCRSAVEIFRSPYSNSTCSPTIRSRFGT